MEAVSERVTLLTVDEVCDRLRVSKATVYRKIMAGELRAVRLGSGPTSLLRVPEDGLERFLAAHTVDHAATV